MRALKVHLKPKSQEQTSPDMYQVVLYLTKNGLMVCFTQLRCQVGGICHMQQNNRRNARRLGGVLENITPQ